MSICYQEHQFFNHIETKLDRLTGAVESLAASLNNHVSEQRNCEAMPVRRVPKKRREPAYKTSVENKLAVSSHLDPWSENAGN
jgi:hypothetical protein